MPDPEHTFTIRPQPCSHRWRDGAHQPHPRRHAKLRLGLLVLVAQVGSRLDHDFTRGVIDGQIGPLEVVCVRDVSAACAEIGEHGEHAAVVLRHIAQPELEEHAADVRLDRFRAEPQRLADPLVGASFGH